jgi:predicted nucleic acid binding AN1-type Zn finger protein
MRMPLSTNQNSTICSPKTEKQSNHNFTNIIELWAADLSQKLSPEIASFTKNYFSFWASQVPLNFCLYIKGKQVMGFKTFLPTSLLMWQVTWIVCIILPLLKRI